MNQQAVMETVAPASRIVTASVLGGSGYTGGELLRLLLQHPQFELVAATSGRWAGKPLHHAHPNLRGATDLRFSPRDALPEADLVFSCLPHGAALEQVPELLERGTTVIDLSSDFRLDPTSYQKWYNREHPHPDLLAERVYGLPERHRAAIPVARLVSGVGCFATACNLALLPLARAGLLADATVIIQGQIGSSAAGIEANDAGQHAARSRSLRIYAPTTHRHAAEVIQESGVDDLHVTVQSTELVRGILATAHVLLPPGVALDERDAWRLWRDATHDEPFLRVVKERSGVHRGPDPKLVAGSNFADLGFHVEPPAEPNGRTRIVATCAIDNLQKGAAGTAVQAANIRFGFPETAGLTALPCHPV